MANYNVNIGSYQFKSLSASGYGVNIGTYLGNALPVILAQATSMVVVRDVLVSLFITATGSPIPTYQWYLNGLIIPGATASTYQYYAAENQSYRCVVSNIVGSVNSLDIQITVTDNPYRYSAFNLQIDQDRS